MKKVICIIAVFALTAPVFADPNVQIICEVVSHDSETNTGTICVSFDARDAWGTVRGFALDISLVGDGCTPTYRGITPGSFKTGISTSGDGGYGIFPGALKDLGGPDGDNWGDPQAPEDQVGAKGGIGDSQFTVELASLYDPEEEDDAPDPCGVLFYFDYDCNDCEVFQVNIEGEPLRGGDTGLVTEDAENVEMLAEGCEVVCAEPPCFTGTVDEVEAWEFWGEPANWCDACWRCGDLNGTGTVTFGDVQVVLGDFNNVDTSGRSDASMNGQLTFGDVQIVLGFFNAAQGCTACE